MTLALTEISASIPLRLRTLSLCSFTVLSRAAFVSIMSFFISTNVLLAYTQCMHTHKKGYFVNWDTYTILPMVPWPVM